MTTVHVVLPDGIDDPTRPSGGNRYDRRVCDGLGARGWTVVEHAVGSHWPHPTAFDLAALDAALDALPAGSPVLVDGLVGCAAPDAMTAACTRLRVVMLVHMPLGAGRPDTVVPDAAAGEGAVLTRAAGVVATSTWARDLLVSSYDLDGRVVVAEPGADAAEVVEATPDGRRLLAVGAVTPVKGHDVLVTALATLTDLPCQLTIAGARDRDPAYADALARAVAAHGIADRVTFAGVLDERGLEDAYRRADLLVQPSRGETYGMVVTEALARGIPVIASAAGGLPHALGCDSNGARPGLLVPEGDFTPLAAALRQWLGDAELRARLRSSALDRRRTLAPWSATAVRISDVLDQVLAAAA